LALLSISNPILAKMEDKLSNHWAKNEIREEFFVYYFPYLAKEDFKNFSPNSPIKENEFLLSFSALLKKQGYNNNELGWGVDLTRGQMARIIGGKLLEENIIHKGSKDPSFKDIKNRSMEEQNSIKALYNAGIIEGENSIKYSPNRLATQAEAIVLLQRVEKVLDQNTIPFNLSGIIQTYSGNEGISIKENSDKIVLSITKSFPTPGYNMEVEKITRGEDNYKIHLNITPPPKDSEQLQVITFKTITIEINKKHITPPYIFIMEGSFLSKY
ncbi:MAG: hypothetical protein GX968_02755, partial [Tissierellia bacterium]|nr:hypothetical protein [Tissierellia bacterium]